MERKAGTEPPVTVDDTRPAARRRHPSRQRPTVVREVPVVIGPEPHELSPAPERPPLPFDVADVIGRSLLRTYYGAVHDPVSPLRDEPAVPVAEPVPVAERMPPREVKARWRAFRAYWVGHLLSIVGDHFTIIALPLAAQKITGSALVVGLVVFAETLATVLFGTAVGTYADRKAPRPVMIATDLIRAALLVLLAVLFGTNHLTAAVIVGLSFCLGALRLLHDGAESSMIARLVPDELDVRSQSRITLSENVGSTIGPLAAGLASSTGLWLAFGVDAVTFLAAAGAVAAMARVASRRRMAIDVNPPPVDERPSFRSEYLDTLHLFRGEPVYLAALAVTSLFNAAMLPIGAQFVSLASGQLHLSAVWIGAMFTVSGVGGILAAPLVERGSTIRTDLILWGGAAISAGILAVGLFPSTATVVVAFAVAGPAFTLLFTHYAALRQRSFPAEAQGRVALTSRVALWSTVLLGSLLTGWLADATSPSAMWIACGALGLATAAGGARAGLGAHRVD